MYRKFFKYILDVIASTLLLVATAPLWLLVLVTLAFAHRGNPFFTQVRPGKDEKLFRIIKFKTMNERKDHLGNLLPDKDRLTVIGRVVRKLSLDELPQLFNVLKGDLSLIGPRPLLEEYLTLYNDRQKRRHLVKPGISGWAQVNGRNAISWEQKFELDVYYVENQSFMLDVKILFLTVLKIFKLEGINAEGEATVSKFVGNRDNKMTNL